MKSQKSKNVDMTSEHFVTMHWIPLIYDYFTASIKDIFLFCLASNNALEQHLTNHLFLWFWWASSGSDSAWKNKLWSCDNWYHIKVFFLFKDQSTWHFDETFYIERNKFWWSFWVRNKKELNEGRCAKSIDLLACVN